MAHKFECDFCHRQFNDSCSVGELSYPILDSLGDPQHDAHVSKDICGRCIKELQEFLSGLKIIS